MTCFHIGWIWAYHLNTITTEGCSPCTSLKVFNLLIAFEVVNLNTRNSVTSWNLMEIRSTFKILEIGNFSHLAWPYLVSGHGKIIEPKLHLNANNVWHSYSNSMKITILNTFYTNLLNDSSEVQILPLLFCNNVLMTSFRATGLPTEHS